MIVNDFDLVRVAISPYKTDPPLFVDADRMLSLTVASQGF